MPKALRRSLLFVSSLLLALLTASCGDTHQKIAEETLSRLDEVATIVEGVEDKDGAEKAAKKLDDLASKFESLAERRSALGEPDAGTSTELKAKVEKMNEFQKRMAAGMLSAGSKDPRTIPILQKPLQRIGEAISKVR